MLLYVIIAFLSNDTDHKTEHLTTEQAIILQECNVIDMLLSDGGDTQSGVSESPMRINKRINIELN